MPSDPTQTTLEEALKAERERIAAAILRLFVDERIIYQMMACLVRANFDYMKAQRLLSELDAQEYANAE
jgi:hypothetical protein